MQLKSNIKKISGGNVFHVFKGRKGWAFVRSVRFMCISRLVYFVQYYYILSHHCCIPVCFVVQRRRVAREMDHSCHRARRTHRKRGSRNSRAVLC